MRRALASLLAVAALMPWPGSAVAAEVGRTRISLRDGKWHIKGQVTHRVQ